MSQCNSVEGVAEHFGIGTERYHKSQICSVVKLVVRELIGLG